ncbi:O-antigen ligase family protein [Clostridium saccharobutylicum]|uniref:O-antigen ligase like membrane protein n=2 Tax=Clostridium saccharobutylicum TaxID=169679 RepID=U5MSN8_CLOSA|nr:O-antigen ligase family protein [Clostridium saccharobutylicum]AGX43824.1 O-antigen ligase like membrane protein [Clostridium saccharobutylicum DSM 13864]AQR91124.1 hypothetical protein CLOSC_28480 [Clostridium saccharobutylicum]AQS01028.1 hypothetical protein CSACC_28550 [Clostridium saccharobutylicum]AQS15011.1 hypothetical protein CLOSACC_28550 [Clostridium saccharobutylicum]MBA2905135.1 hypothetical protein [Clostridium saccharobutylicum]
MNYKINTKFKFSLEILLLIALADCCFYFVDYQEKLFGVASGYDISMIIFFLYFIWNFVRYGTSLFKNKKYKLIILFIPILAVISSISAFINYNQGIVSGLLTHRYWIVISFLYFPISTKLQKGKLKIEEIKNAILVVASIELLLVWLQYFFADKFFFLKVIHNYRYGSIRLYIDYSYIIMSMYICFDEILKGKKKIKNIILVVITILYVIFINKSRMLFAAIIATLSLNGLLGKGKLRYRIIFGAILLTSFSYIMNTQLMQEFINAVVEKGNDPTYEIRLLSQSFYLEGFYKSPVFGYGFPNTSDISAYYSAGIGSGYLVADNGIYGYLFSYGLIGICWFLSLFSIFLKNGFLYYYRNRSSWILLMTAYLIITIATNCTWFFNYYSFYVVLILIFCEYSNLKKENIVINKK